MRRLRKPEGFFPPFPRYPANADSLSFPPPSAPPAAKPGSPPRLTGRPPETNHRACLEPLRRPMPMTLGHAVLALAILLSALWTLIEFTLLIARPGKETWGPRPRLRLGSSCIPSLVTAWIYLSAGCCRSNLRRHFYVARPAPPPRPASAG